VRRASVGARLDRALERDAGAVRAELAPQGTIQLAIVTGWIGLEGPPVAPATRAGVGG
jgi:hypothetical protein